MFRYLMFVSILTVTALCAQDASPYLIRGGERIKIVVPPAIGESAEQMVSQDGYIALPTGQLLNIKNKSLPEVQTLLVAEIKKNSGAERVFATIAILQTPQDRIFVGGEVRSPQGLVMEPGRPMELAAALIAVGGATPQADLTRISIVRNGQDRKVISADISSLGKVGNKDLGPLLEPGDIITVPRSPIIILSGEFEKPGAYYLGELHINGDVEPRLSRVIASSGGLRATANRKNLRLVRTGPNGEKEIQTITLDQTLTAGAEKTETADPRLRDGDLIVAAPGGGVTILGRVRQPGSYPVAGAHLKLTRLIALAGGFEEFAKSSRVIVVRTGAQPVRVDVEAIAKGESADKDLDLDDGDLVFVGEKLL